MKTKSLTKPWKTCPRYHEEVKILTTKNYYPSNKLLTIIDNYWSVKNNTVNNINLPVVPDGCMDIIYKKTSTGEDIILVGAMDKGIVVSLAPSDFYFGIRFKPSILSFILNQKMNIYSNKIVSLKEVSTIFYNKLYSFKDKDILNIKKLDLFFEEKNSEIQIDNRVIDLINSIEKHQGNIEINDLIKKANISQRQIERLFLNHLGYSPKRFIRVIRFYNIHKNIIKHGTNNLSLVANEYGYFDQAHFNKEYKEFTNFSPKDENMSILYNTKK